MEVSIETTNDGSNTLYVKEIDEHYHSIKGALTESQHIFINCGLKEIQNDKIDIFEVGFGTGLNAILTLLNGKSKHISYTTIEKFPLPIEIITRINYSSIFNEEEYSIFRQLHEAQWNEYVEISKDFTLKKIQSDLTTHSFSDNYDLVYYDAFSPEKQPEMWEEKIFNKIFNCLRPGGVLVTYCAKGEIRRRMQKVGFTVERLAGPPNGKREILRARKPY